MLIGRDSDVVKDYKIKNLPLLVIVDFEGKVALYEKFADDEEMIEVIDEILKKKQSKE